MNKIQGTLRSFRVDDTQHGVRLTFTLMGDTTVHQGTFLADDNKMLHMLTRSGRGDDVELFTDDEGVFNEVTFKNFSCDLRLKLKQPKRGAFDGAMYDDPDETLVLRQNPVLFN